jgi:hypothetical protein
LKTVVDEDDHKPFDWDDEPYLISEELRDKITNTQNID